MLPGPGWTGCWDPGSELGTGLAICRRLQFYEISSDRQHREH